MLLNKILDSRLYFDFNRILLFLFIMGFSIMQLLAQTNTSYSFIVAGHAYGAHATQSNGLHPKFLASLNAGFDTSARLIVLTGDIVNNSTMESWQQVEQELAKYNIPAYYVMGNHDYYETGIAVFEAKYGKTYYSFDFQRERFIILNSIEADRAISATQLLFLKEQLETAPDTIKNVFIFFHEVIWNSHEKYKGVLSNSRSRYAAMVDYSNYWQEVHPMLEQYPDKKIFVVAGDVGGNPDAVAAFYDQWDNITLLASGMGEVEDENYLLASVMDDGSVGLKLIPLNAGVTMHEIEYYSVPKSPEFIVGETTISAFDSAYEYVVTEIENADSYSWELPENANGTSNANAIQVSFTNDFVSGEIAVRASNVKFGSSVPISQKISSDATALPNETIDNLQLSLYQTNQRVVLKIFGKSTYDLQVKVLDMNGRIMYSNNINSYGKSVTQIGLPYLQKGLYLISVSCNQFKRVEKIYLW